MGEIWNLSAFQKTLSSPGSRNNQSKSSNQLTRSQRWNSQSDIFLRRIDPVINPVLAFSPQPQMMAAMLFPALKQITYLCMRCCQKSSNNSNNRSFDQVSGATPTDILKVLKQMSEIDQSLTQMIDDQSLSRDQTITYMSQLNDQIEQFIGQSISQSIDHMTDEIRRTMASKLETINQMIEDKLNDIEATNHSIDQMLIEKEQEFQVLDSLNQSLAEKVEDQSQQIEDLKSLNEIVSHDLDESKQLNRELMSEIKKLLMKSLLDERSEDNQPVDLRDDQPAVVSPLDDSNSRSDSQSSNHTSNQSRGRSNGQLSNHSTSQTSNQSSNQSSNKSNSQASNQSTSQSKAPKSRRTSRSQSRARTPRPPRRTGQSPNSSNQKSKSKSELEQLLEQSSVHASDPSLSSLSDLSARARRTRSQSRARESVHRPISQSSISSTSPSRAISQSTPHAHSPSTKSSNGPLPTQPLTLVAERSAMVAESESAETEMYIALAPLPSAEMEENTTLIPLPAVPASTAGRKKRASATTRKRGRPKQTPVGDADVERPVNCVYFGLQESTAADTMEARPVDLAPVATRLRQKRAREPSETNRKRARPRKTPAAEVDEKQPDHNTELVSNAAEPECESAAASEHAPNPSTLLVDHASCAMMDGGMADSHQGENVGDNPAMESTHHSSSQSAKPLSFDSLAFSTMLSMNNPEMDEFTQSLIAQEQIDDNFEASIFGANPLKKRRAAVKKGQLLTVYKRDQTPSEFDL